MSDVAARAGVSQATVSFVLGGRADRLKISTQTRERVLNVAREMGYQRNQLARAMITGKSRILGVLTSPEFGENIVRILAGAVEVASNNEFLLKVIHLSHSGIDDATITRCLEWRLAGAMVVGLSEPSVLRVNQEFAAKRLPLAMIDNAPASDWGIRIRSNDAQGMGDVVSHLVGLGHRRIAFLGGLAGHLSTWREMSVRSALSSHGLSVPSAWVLHTAWGNQAVIEAGVRCLLEVDVCSRPTAVICAGDTIAMVVQRVARSVGLRLPDDLSITGYSNASLSSYADPSLTTVDQSFYEMGQAAAMHLIEKAAPSDAEKEEASSEEESGLCADFLTPARLIVRNSTAVAPPP